MPPSPRSTRQHQPTESLARSATLLSIGAVASRALGLAREMVIASYFGATGAVSAFTVAGTAPKMLYDFLIGGMLSAALVPVLSDYARLKRGPVEKAAAADPTARPLKVGPNPDLVRLVGALSSLSLVTLALVALAMAVFAPQVARLLAGGFVDFEPELLP